MRWLELAVAAPPEVEEAAAAALAACGTVSAWVEPGLVRGYFDVRFLPSRPGARLGIAGALIGDRETLSAHAAEVGLDRLDEAIEPDPCGDLWWSAWLALAPAARRSATGG